MMNTPSTSQHGHIVLDLIAQHQPIAIDQLKTECEKLWGQEARFHTCSAADMDFDALMIFLQSRQKITLQNGVCHIGSSPRCADGDEHHHHEHELTN